MSLFIYDLKMMSLFYCERKAHEIAWYVTECLWSRELMICYVTKQWWIENAFHSNHPTDWMTTALPPLVHYPQDKCSIIVGAWNNTNLLKTAALTPTL
jgi:hypothetical protein